MPGTPANSPKLNLPRYDNATDAADFAGQVNAVVDTLDDNTARFEFGTAAARPAANALPADTYYFATDSAVLSRTNGTAWTDLNPRDAAATISSLRKLGTGATDAAAGNDGRLVASSAVAGRLNGVSAFIATLLDDADAATARATLGTDAAAAARPPSGAAGGDLGGTFPNPDVDGITGLDASAWSAGYRCIFLGDGAHGGALIWDVVGSAQRVYLAANFNPVTNRLINTDDPGWMLRLSANDDNLILARAAPTTAAPAFSDAPLEVSAAGVINPNGVPWPPPLVTTGSLAAGQAGIPNPIPDGLIVDYLVDAANGIISQLRRRAASTSPYKWETRGASALYAKIAAADSTLSTSLVDLTGPSVVAPLAGEYILEAGATIDLPVDNGTRDALIAYKIGTATAVILLQETINTAGTPAERLVVAGAEKITVPTAGSTVKLQYRTSGTPTAAIAFSQRYLKLRPVRLG